MFNISITSIRKTTERTLTRMSMSAIARRLIAENNPINAAPCVLRIRLSIVSVEGSTTMTGDIFIFDFQPFKPLHNQPYAALKSDYALCSSFLAFNSLKNYFCSRTGIYE